MEKIKKFLKKYWLAFVIIALCFIVDLITKTIITKNIEYKEVDGKLVSVKSVEVIKDFFWITYTRNTGAGWSMLSGKTGILIIITIIAIGFFVFLMKDYDMKKNTYYSLGLSLMLGGLFGNFVERVFKGYVTDFLDFLIFGYDYPVFNVADMCLVAGAISLIVAIVITKEDVLEFGLKKKQSEKEQQLIYEQDELQLNDNLEVNRPDPEFCNKENNDTGDKE